MISIKSIAVIIIMTLLVGTSGVLGIVEDGIYTVMCGGCETGWRAFSDSVSSILTAGQNDVNFGVDGLLELQSIIDSEAGSPEKTVLIERNMIFGGIFWLYWVKILLGSFLTIIYIWILTKIIKKPFEWIVGFEPPWFATIVIALLITGAMHFVFTGFTQIPFQGWIKLASHPELWSAKMLELISPLPPEATNLSSNLTSNVSLPI